MSDEAATIEVTEQTQELGDKIAALTLKEAKELSDYLEQEYGIKPAAGGGVVMAAPAAADGDAGEEEKTDFDVVLTGFGDSKLAVVKIVKNIAGCSLMEAKKLVEGVPATLKQAVPTEEAEKLKAELEGAGASVELK